MYRHELSSNEVIKLCMNDTGEVTFRKIANAQKMRRYDYRMHIVKL